MAEKTFIDYIWGMAVFILLILLWFLFWAGVLIILLALVCFVLSLLKGSPVCWDFGMAVRDTLNNIVSNL